MYHHKSITKLNFLNRYSSKQYLDRNRPPGAGLSLSNSRLPWEAVYSNKSTPIVILNSYQMSYQTEIDKILVITKSTYFWIKSVFSFNVLTDGVLQRLRRRGYLTDFSGSIMLLSLATAPLSVS